MRSKGQQQRIAQVRQQSGLTPPGLQSMHGDNCVLMQLQSLLFAGPPLLHSTAQIWSSTTHHEAHR